MKSRLLSLCAITILLATSCATVSVYKERVVTSLFFDYRPYTSAGFYVSSDHYYGEAEPIGELWIEIKPAVEERKETVPGSRKKFDDGVYDDSTPISLHTIINREVIPAEELLDIAVKEALSKGANGLSNLEMRLIRDSGMVYYKITGLCLRIPEKKASAN